MFSNIQFDEVGCWKEKCQTDKDMVITLKAIPFNDIQRCVHIFIYIYIWQIDVDCYQLLKIESCGCVCVCAILITVGCDQKGKVPGDLCNVGKLLLEEEKQDVCFLKRKKNKIK